MASSERSSGGVQDTCGREDAIVDANEIQPLKHAAASGERLLARREERAQDFRARKSARDQRTAPPEVPAQGGGLRLSYGQFHDC